MQVQQLIRLLVEPEVLFLQELSMLERLVREYPYFSLAHALLAKYVYFQSADTQELVVQRAATYAIDRAHLRAWLENKLLFPASTQVTATKTVQQRYTDNDYLEMIVKKSSKKSTNVKAMQQFSVIDTFLNKNLQFDPFVELFTTKTETTFVDLVEQDDAVDGTFATETLATIMVQQKKYKRAIEIYEQLLLKYPEKKVYFSGVIAKLKDEL